jgi:hypothetical protein
MGPVLRMLCAVPGLRGFADDVKPMPIDVLARAIVRVVKDRAPLATVMTGRTLWQAAALQ